MELTNEDKAKLREIYYKDRKPAQRSLYVYMHDNKFLEKVRIELEKKGVKLK